jgi:hypothetical protein
MWQLILLIVIFLLSIGQLTSNQSGGSAIYNMIRGGGKSKKGKR